MRKIPSGKTAISSIKERRLRIYKIEDEIEGFNDNTLDTSVHNEINQSSAHDSPVKKKRRYKRRIKSGIALNSTFPSVIDFNHPYRQILMAIKTKPFILMAGMCGTGKSRFARTLAYQTCPKYLQEEGQPGNFQMIQVQPNWCDSDEIMGWLNRQGQYQWTPVLLFLVKAWRHIDTPFILCLDEMNLAKVEHYFANFLSALESRQWINNQCVSDSLITGEKMKHYAEKDPDIWVRMGLKLDNVLQNKFLSIGLAIPPNLVVIGTANTDESGQMFSMKVLDRMMVIEFSEIDFYGGIKSDDTDFKFPCTPVSSDHVLGTMLYGKDAYTLSPDNGDIVISELQALDKIFSEAPFRFGYRARDSALIYCAYNSQLPESPKSSQSVYKFLDEIILMKILPRISGDKKSLEGLMKNLLRFTKTKYPRSFQRVTYMLNDSNDFFSYISFWR